MTFDEVRRHFGSLLGNSIPPGGFEKVALEADSQGRFGSRQMIRMIIKLYNYLEEHEHKSPLPQDDLPQKENIQPAE